MVGEKGTMLEKNLNPEGKEGNEKEIFDIV